MSWPNQLAAPLSIKDGANQLAGWIGLWAKPKGGKCEVVQGLRHLWESIFMASDAPRVLVCFNGETARGGFDEQDTLHRVDRQWAVVVIRGHGWKNLMPDEDETAAETFMETVEALRDRVRLIQTLSEEFPVNYKGAKPLPAVAKPDSANVFVDAYQLDFSSAADIPDVAQQP